MAEPPPNHASRQVAPRFNPEWPVQRDATGRIRPVAVGGHRGPALAERSVGASSPEPTSASSSAGHPTAKQAAPCLDLAAGRHAGLSLAGRRGWCLVGKAGRPGHQPALGAGRHGKRQPGASGRRTRAAGSATCPSSRCLPAVSVASAVTATHSPTARVRGSSQSPTLRLLLIASHSINEHQGAEQYPVVAFIDSNVALECSALGGLPWKEI